jgi:hypothetical protein
MLANLNDLKDDLAKQKAQLETNKVKVEKDESQIEEEKTSLVRDKAELDTQRDVYYQKRNESLATIGDQQGQLNIVTEEEQKALAQQQKLEQQIFDSIHSIPSGSYVAKGTIIGRQGCSGLCTGPHLHFGVVQNGSYVNPCTVLPSGHLPGCGVSNTKLRFPMGGSYVLTSGYGWRWGSFHYGLDIANYDSDTPIYAAHSGYIVYLNDHSCSSYSGSLPCNGQGANYAVICQNASNCNVGLKTMYLHLR